MENEKHYFSVGLFVIGLLTAAFFTILWFSTLGAQQRYTTYAIYFDGAVSGLSAGSPVLFKGLNVGRVNEIGFKNSGSDKIVVLADIEDRAPVRTDTVATIRLLGITGASALSLENTETEGTPLVKEEGQQYPVIQARASGLEKFFDELPQFIDRLSALAERLELALNDENIEAFGTLLNASADAAESASDAASGISSLTRQLRGVLGGQTGGEIQDVLTEAKIAMREIKMLAKSLREDPSKILRGPKYEGQRIAD